ncbi:protein PERCC1-like [Lytechinus pictus]|uniref:protein PERCC1-like n=1 Tax=Lytechinus pictus TaxID=7653 RepID=UPI0030B9D2A1
MAMMNYQMASAYPHSMQNYMDYPMHNPHIHTPLMHPIQNHHFHHPPQINNQSSMHFSQDEYYVEDSDDESNFTSEDYEDDRMSDELSEREPSAVDQLLDFAETASSDIQKFFGKKRVLDEPELIADCNKKVRLSGRELYYADLLRVAQQGDSADPCKDTSEPNRIVRYGDDESSPDLTATLSPKSIDSNGLGPLEELFNYAERNMCYSSTMLPMYGYSAQNSSWMPPTDNANDSTLGGKLSVTPWRKRAMPKSFFTEPAPSSASRVEVDQRFVGLGLPLDSVCAGSVASSNHHEAPDFSDLIATMESDDDHGLPRVTPVHG